MLLPAEAASQVFISLITSLIMLVILGNYQPYLDGSDDVLAQFCQISLSLAMVKSPSFPKSANFC
jgi:hypothetical protein